MAYPGGRFSTDNHSMGIVHRWQLKPKRGSLPCMPAKHKTTGTVHWAPKGRTRTLCGLHRRMWYFTKGRREVTCKRCLLLKTGAWE